MIRDKTAFTERHSAIVWKSINQLKDRMLQGTRLELTHDEFLALFATSEEIDLLKRAVEVADIEGRNRSFDGQFSHINIAQLTGESVATLRFYVQGTSDKPAPLCPRNKRVLKDANPEVLERITSWVTERITIGQQFSRVHNVFTWLNRHCASKDQVRFLWPSIIPLLNLHVETKDLANKLREVRPPRSMPAIPPAVREACKLSAGAVAMAGLLDDATLQAGYVAVSVDLWECGTPQTELGYLNAS